MNIPNPEETERIWLKALEDENQKCVAKLQASSPQGRAMTPEELVGILNYLHAVDQYYCGYVATGEALSGLGRPALTQRLARVRDDLHGAITTYGEMYRSAQTYRTDWQQMQRDAALYATGQMMESNAHTKSVYDRMNRLQQLVNEGVPYPLALAMSQNPA